MIIYIPPRKDGDVYVPDWVGWVIILVLMLVGFIIDRLTGG